MAKIFGDDGDYNDFFHFNISNSGPIEKDLGDGDDTVSINASAAVPQVRVTFTSSEVGNDEEDDSGDLANQDGGLAVRVQAESASGALRGPVSRFDDEGTTFNSYGKFTFDVRDLVSGAGRGDQFGVVKLGTEGNNSLFGNSRTEAFYINGGMGDDKIIGGFKNDFLVGGAGDDVMSDRAGNDTFLGGAGDDRITGGIGNDTAIFNVSTDGGDRVNLGTGLDTVNVSAAATTTQVRLTFTSSEVGNDNARDSGTLASQDGDLAVRLQAEESDGDLTGDVSRYDDEGTRFVSTVSGVTFDVRDLVSGTERGNQFNVVELGTKADDSIYANDKTLSYYINAGMGNDKIIGGYNADFLVGGGGDDVLTDRGGNDSFIGGGGNDLISGGTGDDTAIFNVATDGSDNVNLGTGSDTVSVAAPVGSQVRLTFTSAEVGNDNARDSLTMANQDGELAVRLQAEDGTDALTGAVSRFDDEGVSFTSSVQGVTFDVRDLVSGVARGDQFNVVRLGTSGNDSIDESGKSGAYYINGGMGDDSIIGTASNDFLVGGAGNDTLSGLAGDDTFIGGAGNDVFVFASTNGTDRINDFVSGTDKIDLRSFAGLDFGDITSAVIGANALVNVDTNNDGASDFSIVLVNAGSPVASDYLFA